MGAMVGDLFVPGFDEWSMERQQEFAEMIDHPVRKTAHAAEYAVLGLLAAGVCIPSIASRSDENEIQEEAGYGGFINSRSGKSGQRTAGSMGDRSGYAATDEVSSDSLCRAGAVRFQMWYWTAQVHWRDF